MTEASKHLIAAVDRARAAGQPLVICYDGEIIGLMYPPEYHLVDASVITVGNPAPRPTFEGWQ
jgi:hypothetical protein